jgi:predicted secreted Zn-dependent protease
MRGALGGAFDRIAGLLWRRERLFSYGTLQLEKVQLATFGRRLAGSADTLSGYRLGSIEVASDDAVAISGVAAHPIVRATGNPLDLVAGMVFEVTPAELAQADAYESIDYQRVRVTLTSGRRAWVYAAALALAAGSAQALPIVRSSTQTYAVVGATEGEVRASLDQAPLSPDGRRRVGYTEADIEWKYGFRESGGKCRVTSVTVTLNAKVTLPAWQPPYGASRGLRDRWEAFLAALARHEQSHVDIGYAAAKRIEDALWRAPMPRTCRGYDDALGRMANEIFDAAEREQEAYDQRTDHGAAEGVRFP